MKEEKNYAVCPKCKYYTPISSGEKFCPICGTKLIHQCPECGREIVSPFDKYCPFCGHPYGGKHEKKEKKND